MERVHARGRSGCHGAHHRGRATHSKLLDELMPATRRPSSAIPQKQRASVLNALALLNNAIGRAGCCALNAPVTELVTTRSRNENAALPLLSKGTTPRSRGEAQPAARRPPTCSFHRIPTKNGAGRRCQSRSGMRQSPHAHVKPGMTVWTGLECGLSFLAHRSVPPAV